MGQHFLQTLVLLKLEISASLIGQLARMQTLPTYETSLWIALFQKKQGAPGAFVRWPQIEIIFQISVYFYYSPLISHHVSNFPCGQRTSWPFTPTTKELNQGLHCSNLSLISSPVSSTAHNLFYSNFQGAVDLLQKVIEQFKQNESSQERRDGNLLKAAIAFENFVVKYGQHHLNESTPMINKEYSILGQ